MAKRALKPKRVVTRVQWLKAKRVWRVHTTIPKDIAAPFVPTYDSSYPRKTTAVSAAAAASRTIWRRGIHAQLVIHRKNGTIQDERTYGADPRRSKG